MKKTATKKSSSGSLKWWFAVFAALLMGGVFWYFGNKPDRWMTAPQARQESPTGPVLPVPNPDLEVPPTREVSANESVPPAVDGPALSARTNAMILPESSNRPPSIRVSTNRLVDTSLAAAFRIASGSAMAATHSGTLTHSGYPRPARDVLELQIALARVGFSSGSLDGVDGAQTRAALRAWESRRGSVSAIARTNEWRGAPILDRPPLKVRTIVEADFAGLAPVPTNWVGKAEAHRLDHETLIERIAEEVQSSPGLLRRLNPSSQWNVDDTGASIWVPDVGYPPAASDVALIRVRLAERTLAAVDETGRVVAHFPCSIAQRVEKRPVGELYVKVVIPWPDYTFDPQVFPESAEARTLSRKLILPPGPNNPVGVAWIGLDRPGYGIHGTPKPEDVGRTESHGCFRLGNWNADYLRQLVRVGMPVRVEP